MEETVELIKQNFLTQDELSQIKKIQEDANELVFKFGQIETQIQILELQKQDLIDELKTNKSNEIKVSNKIRAKYGEININIETGEYSPIR